MARYLLIAMVTLGSYAGHVWWVFAAAVLAGPLVFVGSCWLAPYANCLCCVGKGRHYRDDRKVHRDCWWCKGSGRRLRVGRRIYNAIHKRRSAAK